MTDRELLKETLKILDKAKWVLTQSSNEKPQKVMFQLQSKDWFEMTTKINNRLAQPEPQETIAKWIKANTEHRQWYICPKCSYQAPRFKDEWQGLTDEEVGTLTVFDGLHHVEVPVLAGFARAIEAKLKAKNHD